MASCKNCGSAAINPSLHGRIDGKDLDLCDVCYWRSYAESLELRVEALESRAKEDAKFWSGLADRGDALMAEMQAYEERVWGGSKCKE